MFKPKVRATNMLRESIADLYDPADFCDLFADWKTGWPKNEHAYWFFGKDGDYLAPKRNGRRVLRHVHLPPQPGTDRSKQWDKAYERKSRKVSDVALVYAFDPAHGHLLIFVAREPKGHELSDMATEETRRLMHLFADQAEAFIFQGSIYL